MQKQLIMRPAIGLAVYLFAFSFCISAHAQIAFSARYYFPPGSKKTSHYHIYLMQISTGRVKQLTDSHWDDVDVHFSPDGEHLGFIRRSYDDSDTGHYNGSICLYSMAKSRIVKQLAFTGKSILGGLQWNRSGGVVYLEGGPALAVNGSLAAVPQDADPTVSPDGLYQANEVSHDGRDGLEVLNVRTRRSMWKMFSAGCASGIWVAPHTYIVLDTSACGRAGTSTLLSVTFNGKTVHSNYVAVHDAPGSAAKLPPIGQLLGMTASGFTSCVLIREYDGNSTIGPEFGFWQVTVATGATTFMGYGAHLAFSHTPSVYFTCSSRNLAQYGSRRTVWVSQLVFHSLQNHSSRILVGGLVRVRSVTWR